MKPRTIRSIQIYIVSFILAFIVLAVGIGSYLTDPEVHNVNYLLVQLILILIFFIFPFAYEIKFYEEHFFIRSFFFLKRKYKYGEIRSMYIYSPIEGSTINEIAGKLSKQYTKPFSYNPAAQLKFFVNNSEEMINLSLHTSKEMTGIINNIISRNKNIILDDRCKMAIVGDYSFEKPINKAFYIMMFSGFGLMTLFSLLLLAIRLLTN